MSFMSKFQRTYRVTCVLNFLITLVLVNSVEVIEEASDDEFIYVVSKLRGMEWGRIGEFIV